MIPEYKLYHGAVLAELVDLSTTKITVDELSEPGRLTSYLLNDRIGLHIKHSTARLSPWQFTLTKSNLEECQILASNLEHVFLVFVCHTDGMVILNISEFEDLASYDKFDQLWIRVSRRKNEWCTLTVSSSDWFIKKPYGVQEIVDYLNTKY